MWVATEPGLVERMLDMANVAPGDFVIDLGSGDGVIVIAAARRGARALGIEYDPRLVELARRRAAEAGISDRASFVNADIFSSDFTRATVIALYLTESLNLKLRPQLLALRPGTRIVSQPFRMADWEPDDSVSVISFRSLLAPFIGSTNHCFFRCTAYLWVVPARVAGQWRSGDGRLVLDQSFQKVTGRLERDGRTIPLVAGRLRGERISSTAGDIAYAGRVDGNTISGTATRHGASSPWHATLLAKAD